MAAYAGWPPPAAADPAAHGWMPPLGPLGPLGPPLPGPEGRLLSRRALLIVSASVGLGGLMQLAAYLLSRDSSINQDTLIRVDLVLTLTLYAIVATLIISQITPQVKLRWGEGPLISRLANGAVLGLGLGGGLLALVSAAAGHLAPDPRIVLLMSGGDPTHVIVVVLLTCVAAPLVEETLFRGLLLESLRTHGTATAVIGSALFFAVWHFIPAAIIYYTALGAALGLLYLKRGLASSMAAHACFNGVLTVAAIFVVLGPGHTYDVDGLKVTAPSGWAAQTHVDSSVVDSLVLEGPDASGFSLNPVDSDGPFDPDEAAARLRTSAGPIADDTTIDPNSVREVQLPTVGAAVEADIAVDANRGELILFSASGHDYVLVFVNGGSSKAAADFTTMLDSLQPN
jgi:membrane protease YdiL (CAAX protease family)